MTRRTLYALERAVIDFRARIGEELEDATHSALLSQMRYYSERRWCCGWLIDLEYVLWDEIMNSESTDRDLLEIAELAAHVNGWWIWNKDEELERFIELAEWASKFAVWKENKLGVIERE